MRQPDVDLLCGRLSVTLLSSWLLACFCQLLESLMGGGPDDVCTVLSAMSRTYSGTRGLLHRFKIMIGNVMRATIDQMSGGQCGHPFMMRNKSAIKTVVPPIILAASITVDLLIVLLIRVCIFTVPGSVLWLRWAGCLSCRRG